jgi:hypothetical protein
MQFRLPIYFGLLILVSFCACKGVKNDEAIKNDSTAFDTDAVNSNNLKDSIELTELVRELYKWHETTRMKNNGFIPIKSNPSDTTYSGLDMNANTKAIQELKETFLFSDDFLHDYRAIATRMDKELKDGSSIWLDGDMPPFNDDVDEWCNCQDSPVDKYWSIIQLTNLKISMDEATFNWTWGDDFLYKTKARKVNGKWKISYLEGFDMSYYNWAEDAAKVLNFKTSGGKRIVIVKGWIYYDNNPILKIPFYEDILFKDKSNRLIEDHGSTFLFIAVDDRPSLAKLKAFLVTPAKANLVADAMLSSIEDYDNDGNFEFGGSDLTEGYGNPDSMYYIPTQFFELSAGKIVPDANLTKKKDIQINGLYLPPNKQRDKNDNCCVVIPKPRTRK